jgi:hypothetical protein
VKFINKPCFDFDFDGSRPITEVKQRRARSVLGWVTAWEHRVPLSPFYRRPLPLHAFAR